MTHPVASLIISVYNNTDYLKVVLDSLKFQTDKRFEVIISEDAEHEPMRDFLKSYPFEGKLFHLSQPDNGWRKNKAMNRAVEFAHADYLIFIDGDCVLHPRFMEFHLKMAREDCFLAGKRIKLEGTSSQWLMEQQENIPRFQSYLFRNYWKMKRNGALFMEEGFFVPPGSLLGFIPRIRSMHQLKGCNMSFTKKAIYDINGFDEDYQRPATGEDADLAWRFEGLGYKMKSLRNLAVQYHLYHPESWTDQQKNLQLMHEKKERQEYFCSNGILKT